MVPGGVHIGVGTVAARLAHEFGLALAVGLRAMTTRGTGSTGIARIDGHDRYACQCRLVSDEVVELSKAPTREPVACVSAARRDPGSDTTQVFQSDTASGALGTGDDPFRDAVVLMPLEASLPATNSLQLLLGSSGIPPLQPLALQVVLAASRLGGLAAVPGPIAVHGNVADAQIHAQKVGCRNRSPNRSIDRDQQEPLAVLAQHEIHLSLGMNKLPGLVLADQDRDGQTSCQRPQVHLVDTDEPQDSRVIDDRGMFAELGQLVLVPLVDFADPVDHQDRGLRRESEAICSSR